MLSRNNREEIVTESQEGGGGVALCCFWYCFLVYEKTKRTCVGVGWVLVAGPRYLC